MQSSDIDTSLSLFTTAKPIIVSSFYLHFWLRKFVGWSKDFAIIINFFSKIRVKVIIIRKDNIIHFTKSK